MPKTITQIRPDDRTKDERKAIILEPTHTCFKISLHHNFSFLNLC